MPRVLYNVLGPKRADTLRLPFQLLRAAKGLQVEVGPFDDVVSSRVYAWVRGEEKDVERMFLRLDKADINYVKTPLLRERAKG